MTSKAEEISQARDALSIAQARYNELQQASDYLRDELPRARQALQAAKEKVRRLELGDATRQGRISEIARLEERLAELKKEGAV